MLERAVRLLRLYLPLAFGLLVLAGAGGFAWLTAHPEDPRLAAAEAWPLVGPWARAFRQSYLGPGRGAGDSRSPARAAAGGERPAGEASGPEVVYLVPEVVDARAVLWVPRGTRLRESPREGAPVVAVVDALANLQQLERRGEWSRLRWRDAVGWAALPEPEEGGPPPLGSDPEPVLPRVEEPPAPARLARAVELLGPGARELSVGPYRLHTDSLDSALVLLLERAASQLEAVYRQRYGLTPVGEPRAVVVLFSDPVAYRSFSSDEVFPAPDALAGHAFQGLAALYGGMRSPPEVRSTLVHELVHLLNRRALGPALPPWLDEGLADDLAESAFDTEGRPVPGVLGSNIRRQGDAVELHGAVASLHLLTTGAERPLLPLAELLDLSHEELVRSAALSRHYAQASFFIRFLLAGDYAEPFRAFLAEVAGGGPVAPEALASWLGRSLPELDLELAHWLDELAVANPLPAAP